MKVVIAIISRDENGKKLYLLAKSKKDFGEYTGYWYSPGGKIELGETEQQALIRELKEELDLEIKPLKKIAETPGDVPNQTTYWWLCDASGDIKINTEEIAEAGYFTITEMEHMNIWPANKEIFKKYFK